MQNSRNRRVGRVLSDHVMFAKGIYNCWQQQEGLMMYLNRSELNHRPDSLWYHVELLSTSWGNQWQISVVHLEGRAQRHLVSTVSWSWDTVCLLSLVSLPCPSEGALQPAVPPQRYGLFWWLGTTAASGWQPHWGSVWLLRGMYSNPWAHLYPYK